MEEATCPDTQAALPTTWSHEETYDVHGVNSLTVHHDIHLTVVLAVVTMAPVALDANPSYIPLALAISYASAVVFFSSVIGLGLYRSHKDLGPAQDTRHRVSQRRKLTTAFASLAALSFALALGSGISYLTLSYSVWASERGIEVPSIFGNSSSSRSNSTGFHLARWLSDAPVFLDAHEIVAEQPRRVWWGQQLDLASISWMMLLSVEGRRREIPFLWAYAALSQLVSLSFAQNLFYVAMLLTPSAASARELRTSNIFNRFFPPKPTNWFMKPSLYLAVLIINYTAVTLLPYTAGTGWFPAIIGLAKGFQFMPLILPAIVPVSWGTITSTPHGSYKSINRIFKVLSYASGFAHAKSTLSGIYYNLPDAYKHRHSIKIPFDTEKRSTWERSASAAEKILGAMGDHPVVMAIGRDVLLSALSLGLWAAVRAMNVGDIVEAATPFKAKPSENQAIQMFSAVSDRDESPNSITRLPRLASRERRRSAGLRYAVLDGPGGLSEDNDLSTPTPATRKRGRPRKTKANPKPDPEEVPGDETYEPTPAEQASAVGDVVPYDDFDWESAALAWGLTAFGGLGMGSSAVFGAECVSR